jgi:hypothetical protein
MPRSYVTQQPDESDILDDAGVWAERENLFEKLDYLLNLSFEYKNIKRQENFDAIEVGVLNHRPELIDLKRGGSPSGVEPWHSDIHSVRAVMNSGSEHIPGSDRG